MASARKIVVEFIGKDTSLGKTSDSLGKPITSLSQKMQSAGKVAGKLLAGGILAGGAAMVKMGQAAADDEAAQVKLATALRQAAGASDEQIAATEKWITAQGKALGIADDELRPALGRLADATGSVSEAQKLTALAMDVSAGTGKDLNSVIEALVKAENGSIGGLGRLGVATKDAEGKTKSLKDVTADLANLYEGRAAKAADTTAGKQKRFQVALGELGEEIGARVLPAMLKLSEIGLKMVDWISRNQTLVAVLVGTLGGLAAVIWAVSAAMKAYVAVQKALNVVMAMNPIGLVVIAVAALAAGLVIAYKKSETFRKIVNGAFNKVKAVAVGVFNWIKRNWPYLLGALAGPFGLAAVAIAKNWGRIKDGAVAVKNWVVDKFNALVGFFRDLPSRVSSATRGLFDGIKSAFKSAINWVIDGWNNLSFGIPGFDPPGPGPSFGGVSIGTPNIPHLARGGIVRRPTVALIGEAGPEAVVPLGRGRRGGLGGDVHVHLHGQVFGDPRAYARFVVAELKREKVRLGGGPLGLG